MERAAQREKGVLTWVLRQHAFFMAFIILYVLAFFVEASVLDPSRIATKAFTSYFIAYVYLALFVFYICFYMLYVMFFIHPENLVETCLAGIRTKILPKERVLMALPILIFLPIFLSIFTQVKTMIPLANPFSWDEVFAAWDLSLHGGHQPWVWLQPILGHPLVTKGTYILYILWFFVLQGVVFWQTFSISRPCLRMQFFLTFVLSWALMGSIGGTLFSSAGPVFYGEVVSGPNPYAPLLDYLKSLDTTGGFGLIEVQEWLWRVFEEGDVAQFSGISAMPSMHVAMVAIFALLGWRVHWGLGLTFTLFAALILVSSVHLAWHYAVDGYAGILGVCLIWALVGATLRRLPAFADQPATIAARARLVPA